MIQPFELVLNFSLHRLGMLFFPGLQKHFEIEEDQSEFVFFSCSYPPDNDEHRSGASHCFHVFLKIM